MHWRLDEIWEKSGGLKHQTSQMLKRCEFDYFNKQSVEIASVPCDNGS